MNLDNETLTAYLPGTPAFQRFAFTDVNRVTQQTKQRIIYNPNPAMRMVHNRMRAYLRGHVPRSPYATGAVSKASTKTNVKRHIGNRFFLLCDIRNAYQSVVLETLIQCLAVYDALVVSTPDRYRETEDILRRHVMAPEGGLMTGAPSAQDWFNLYAYHLIDLPLGAYCRSHEICYTRYLDDMTLSSLHPLGNLVRGKRKGRKYRQHIKEIITASGMELHTEKTFGHDIYKGPMTVNGIGLDRHGRLFVPRHFFRRVHGALMQALKTGRPGPETINGLMGVVRLVTHPLMCNHLERKLFALYRRWRFVYQGK